MCSHVAALLFKIEAAWRLGFDKLSYTSLPCQWNQAFSCKLWIANIIYLQVIWM